jgi:hypothetical protein
LELWEHHWRESVVKYAVWLSGLVTYAEAATILNTLGQIPISVSSLWRRTWAKTQPTLPCICARPATTIRGKRLIWRMPWRTPMWRFVGRGAATPLDASPRDGGAGRWGHLDLELGGGQVFYQSPSR